jgi:putative Holliday junction resolvase
MGIDFGTKKIGLALSDESGAMAFPHSVIPNDNQLLSTIVTLIEKESVAEVVIGHSLDKSGNENVLHDSVKEFITDLSLAVPVPVHLEPEQFSTQQAKHVQGNHEKLDASAAAIILQSYLDRLKSRSAFEELNQ